MKTTTRRKVTGAITGLLAFAVISTPPSVLAVSQNNQNNNTGTYTAFLEELNSSGISGQVHLKHHMNGNNDDHGLSVNLNARGTTPNQVHPVHIHGNAHPEVAFCPTNEQDANGDGFVSVVEGAATYGPIKLNLTSPQTAFGTPPTPALFTPFAGTPDINNFPLANSNGNIHLNQEYTFDSSVAAQGALNSLLPLENQHIVVHGAEAPVSVDADAFAALGIPVPEDPNTVIYDALLPVACGEIQNTSANQHDDTNTQKPGDQAQGQQDNTSSNQDAPQAVVEDPSGLVVDAFLTRIATLEQEYNAARQAAQVTFETRVTEHSDEARNNYISSLQKARDHYVNQFFEARNQMVDQLNKSGHIQLRDETSRSSEHKLMQFTQEFELMKHQIASRVN